MSQADKLFRGASPSNDGTELDHRRHARGRSRW